MTGINVVPAENDLRDQVDDASPLAVVKAAIRKERESSHYDYRIPIEDSPSVVLRLVAVEVAMLQRIQRQRRKLESDDEYRLLICCDMLAASCRAVFVEVEGQEIPLPDLDSDEMSRFLDVPDDTAELLGRTVANVRALFPKEGLILQAADALAGWAGYERADADGRGNR